MVGHSQDDKGFLSRWAERKRDARQKPEQDEPAADKGVDDGPGDEAALAAGHSGEAAAPEADSDFDLKDLPDVDSMGKEADFSVFMHEKVPEALRRRALRRLWRVDPLFGFRDGMNDYDEDYSDAAMVVEGMKTIYQVGKGMITAEEPDAAERPDDEVAGPGGSDAEAETSGEAASPAAEGQQAEERDPEQLPDEPEEALPVEPVTADDPETVADALAGAGQAPDPAPAPIPGANKSAVRRRWGDGSS